MFAFANWEEQDENGKTIYMGAQSDMDGLIRRFDSNVDYKIDENDKEAKHFKTVSLRSEKIGIAKKAFGDDGELKEVNAKNRIKTDGNEVRFYNENDHLENATDTRVFGRYNSVDKNGRNLLTYDTAFGADIGVKPKETNQITSEATTKEIVKQNHPELESQNEEETSQGVQDYKECSLEIEQEIADKREELIEYFQENTHLVEENLRNKVFKKEYFKDGVFSKDEISKLHSSIFFNNTSAGSDMEVFERALRREKGLNLAGLKTSYKDIYYNGDYPNKFEVTGLKGEKLWSQEDLLKDMFDGRYKNENGFLLASLEKTIAGNLYVMNNHKNELHLIPDPKDYKSRVVVDLNPRNIVDSEDVINSGNYNSVDPYSEDGIYVSTKFADIMKVDKKSGEIIWRYSPAGNQVAKLDPRYGDSLVIINDKSTGDFVALDKDTGGEKWRKKINISEPDEFDYTEQLTHIGVNGEKATVITDHSNNSFDIVNNDGSIIKTNIPYDPTSFSGEKRDDLSRSVIGVHSQNFYYDLNKLEEVTKEDYEKHLEKVQEENNPTPLNPKQEYSLVEGVKGYKECNTNLLEQSDINFKEALYLKRSQEVQNHTIWSMSHNQEVRIQTDGNGLKTYFNEAGEEIPEPAEFQENYNSQQIDSSEGTQGPKGESGAEGIVGNDKSEPLFYSMEDKENLKKSVSLNATEEDLLNKKGTRLEKEEAFVQKTTGLNLPVHQGEMSVLLKGNNDMPTIMLNKKFNSKSILLHEAGHWANRDHQRISDLDKINIKNLDDNLKDPEKFFFTEKRFFKKEREFLADDYARSQAYPFDNKVVSEFREKSPEGFSAQMDLHASKIPHASFKARLMRTNGYTNYQPLNNNEQEIVNFSDKVFDATKEQKNIEDLNMERGGISVITSSGDRIRLDKSDGSSIDQSYLQEIRSLWSQTPEDFSLSYNKKYGQELAWQESGSNDTYYDSDDAKLYRVNGEKESIIDIKKPLVKKVTGSDISDYRDEITNVDNNVSSFFKNLFQK